MSFCIALAVRDMGMTVDEALAAATRGGARALRRDDVGHLAPGARADAVVLDAPSHAHLVYRPGRAAGRGHVRRRRARPLAGRVGRDTVAIAEPPADNVARLLGAYEAFVDGRLELIPEIFAPDGVYRTSGVFPGMQESYRGHERIAVFWHHSNEPWERFEIEPLRTVVDGDRVIAEVIFRGRGLGSGAEVEVGAGHMVTFRDGLIVEFCAYPSFQDAMAAAGQHRSPLGRPVPPRRRGPEPAN